MDIMIGDGRSQNCWGVFNFNVGINFNFNFNVNLVVWFVFGYEGIVVIGNFFSICSLVSVIG